MASFILTVLGDDRPGLVSSLSQPINAHGASWERSQMSRLAGKFAGIAVVTVSAEHYAPLTSELLALSSQGLSILVESTDEVVTPDVVRFTLDLLGDDRPGIVAEISALLASHHVNIEELSTDVRDAPMSGGTLFQAHALLAAPPSVSTDELRSMLEALADELMVDLSLS